MTELCIIYETFNQNKKSTDFNITTDTVDEWVKKNPNCNPIFAFRTDGDVMRRQNNLETEFLQNYYLFGLKRTDLHRQFVTMDPKSKMYGHTCEILGIKMANRKYPIIVFDLDLRHTFKCSANFISQNIFNNPGSAPLDLE